MAKDNRKGEKQIHWQCWTYACQDGTQRRHLTA